MVAAFFWMFDRDAAELTRHTNALADLASEYNLSFFQDLAAMFQCLLRLGRGDHTGLADLKCVDSKLVAANMLGLLTVFRTEAGRRALALGLHEEARKMASSAQALVDQTGEVLWSPVLSCLHAALAIAYGDTETAEKHLASAIDFACQQDARLFQLRAAIDLARLMQEQGRIDEAITLLDPIHNSIDDGDCPEDQAMARELLAELKV